jgi:SAM-dependent methyltransferase
MPTMTREINGLAWRRQMTAFSYRNAAELLAPEVTILAALEDEVARGRILDIGIGTGRTTGTLAPRCASYVGVDYSPVMIDRAKDRFPNLDLRVMDARDMAVFGPAAFDVVIFSFNGIDYVDHDDRLRILSQIHTVLRPGGAFVFSTHRLGTPIAPAIALSNLSLSANPVRAVTGMIKYLEGIRNARHLKPLERHEDQYALLNDSGQQYRLLTYYISPGAQKRQLEYAGFGAVRAFSQAGEEMTFEAGASGETPLLDRENNYMVHYLTRRL